MWLLALHSMTQKQMESGMVSTPRSRREQREREQARQDGIALAEELSESFRRALRKSVKIVGTGMKRNTIN